MMGVVRIGLRQVSIGMNGYWIKALRKKKY
jgi:hypothetical protein